MNKYLTILLILLISCKKEKQESYKTIYPLPYLPVFPGSSWTYINMDGDTVSQTTSSEYQLNSYSSYALYGSKTDPVYVPFWNGEPVYGYSSPKETTTGAFEGYERGLSQIGYLSETLGQGWGIGYSQYGGSSRIVSNIDTSITINSITFNHVITVNDWSYIMFVNPRLTKINYYAKDVGLIKQDILKDTVMIQNLGIISYSIKH